MIFWDFSYDGSEYGDQVRRRAEHFVANWKRIEGLDFTFSITAERELLPQRVRFIHSRIDSAYFESGKDYDKLPIVWVIFITSFDSFVVRRQEDTVPGKKDSGIR